MKKIKLFIPMLGKKNYEFYIFDLSLKNNTVGMIALKLLYFFGYLFLLLSFFIIPFSNIFNSTVDSDSGVLKALILIVPLCVGVFLATAVLNGKRKFIDPPFFLPILLFALGTTTSSVLVSLPSLSNTFGSPNIRGLAGVTVISMMAIYYLSSIYLHNRELYRRAFKLLIAGIITYITLVFVNKYSELMTYENLTLGIGALGGIFVLTKSTPHLRSWKFAMAIVVALMYFYAFLNVKATLISLNFILIPAVFAFVILLITLYLSKRSFYKVILEDTKRNFSHLKSRRFNFWEFFRLLSVWAIILMPVVLILVLIFANAGNAAGLSIISDSLKTTTDSLTSISNYASTNFSVLLFGAGADSLRLSSSLVGNVILTQGLLGIISYIFLMTYTIVAIARFVYNNFKTGGNYIIPSFLLFISSLIAFESLFIYVGIKLIYIFWVCLALITVRYMHKSKKNFVRLSSEDFAINELKVGKFELPQWAKFIIALVIIIVSIYVAHSLGMVVK